MTTFNPFNWAATNLKSLIGTIASSEENSKKIAAQQRNGFDITKSINAGASDGLGNVVRVPSIDGTGVSCQVPDDYARS